MLHATLCVPCLPRCALASCVPPSTTETEEEESKMNPNRRSPNSCVSPLKFGRLLLCLLPLFAADPAWSATVPSFSTGVNSDGSLVALGGLDPHWTIVAGPGISSPRSALVLTNQRNSLGSYYVTTDSRWVWATSSGVAAVNLPYTFELSFDLSGFDPNAVSITGSWGVDNLGTIRVDGAPAIGTGALSLTNPSNFTVPNAFSLTGGFHDGLNTIDIQAIDQGFVGGLDVTALAITAAPIPSIPEPGTAPIMMVGGAVLCWFLRRRRVAEITT